MNKTQEPFIPASKSLPEITLRVIIISLFLTIVLATANAYLALRVGLLTSASIPAAIISMGILRFFKDANILENNLVQTAASAGEAVAGGIVYTIPALIIIHYWHAFNYWENFAIALLGGLLGVMFSVPIRRVLVSEPTLPFPEGRAIAEVLHMGTEHDLGFKEIVTGGILGALLELMQNGFKIVASSIQTWFKTGSTLFGFGAGFSPAMLGAGYLMGFQVAISIFIGAVLGWVIGVPVISYFSTIPETNTITATVMQLWNEKIRYIGIGAMLMAGVWTLLLLIKPLVKSIRRSLQITAKQRAQGAGYQLPRTDRDIPLPLVALGVIILAIGLAFLYQYSMPIQQLGFANDLSLQIIGPSVLYVIVLGFIVVAICGYFSGLVGVTATPGSAILIGCVLFAAIALRYLLGGDGAAISPDKLMAGAAITIIIGSTIMGSAAIANDNIQDLKVGYILGATPWKQQFMLMFGVVISALVIPPIMQLLFNVYGIADVLPHAGMDPTQALAAPPAALMAAVTQAIFYRQLPWDMVLIGIATIIVCIILNAVFSKNRKGISVLGVAIGIYLPLTSSIPLFLGGVMARWVQHGLAKGGMTLDEYNQGRRLGLVGACGLVAGAAIMDVLIAIPFAISGNPDILRILPKDWHQLAGILAIVLTFFIALWLRRIACRKNP